MLTVCAVFHVVRVKAFVVLWYCVKSFKFKRLSNQFSCSTEQFKK